MIDVETLKSLLSSFVSKWNAAKTLEERDLVEAEAIMITERILSNDIQITDVKIGQSLKLDELYAQVTEQELFVKSALARTLKLMEEFLVKSNQQALNELAVMSLIRRIKQKQSALKLWDGDVSYEFVENFKTLENMKAVKNSCFMDSHQGVALLPIKQVTKLKVNKATILPGSNGNGGNSNVDVDVRGGQLTSLFDESKMTWFEYERLDNGPVLLNLKFEFEKEEIVNHILLEGLALAGSFLVEDVLYNAGNGETVSLKTLTQDYNPEVSRVDGDMVWTLYHLPVRTREITFKLSSSLPTRTRTISNDDRTVTRKRYVVGIRNISFSKIEYRSEGLLESSLIDLPNSLYVGTGALESFPDRSFVTISTDVTVDDATWQPIDKTFTFMPDAKLRWKLNVQRNDLAFKKQSSFIKESYGEEVESLLKSVSRFSSPAKIALTSTAANEDIYVIQPKLLRRGAVVDAHLLSETGSGNQFSVPLPVNVAAKGIDPDAMHVYVNGREWYRNDDMGEGGYGTWSYSNDFEEIILDESVPSGAKIKLLLDPERVLLEERPDGFYAQLELPFDPDTETIQVWSAPREAVRRTFILPRSQRIINLNSQNIFDEEFSLVSKAGTTYTEVADRRDLTGNTYFVDKKNGILYLANETKSDTVRVTFKHASKTKVENFKIWYEGNKPVGLILPKTLDLFTDEDTIGTQLRKRIGLRGVEEIRNDIHFNEGTAKVLSHDRIVKGSIKFTSLFGTDVPPEEIEFIDGHSEFYGLTRIDRETTNAITATGSTVSFLLSAGALTHWDLGVTFSNGTYFATEVGSLGAVNSSGEYYIDKTTGTVTVWVGPGGTLPAGIGISYLYRDPDFQYVNKFSVDYLNGTLYTRTVMLSGGTITYKVADIHVHYDIVKPITSFTYDARANIVQVKTETMLSMNSLLKLIWVKDTGRRSLEGLARYFSPIISRLAFRFT